MDPLNNLYNVFFCGLALSEEVREFLSLSGVDSRSLSGDRGIPPRQYCVLCYLKKKGRSISYAVHSRTSNY